MEYFVVQKPFACEISQACLRRHKTYHFIARLRIGPWKRNQTLRPKVQASFFELRRFLELLRNRSHIFLLENSYTFFLPGVHPHIIHNSLPTDISAHTHLR